MCVLLTGNDLRKIDRLFDGWDETLIWSCLQGCMGQAWADSGIDPVSAQIVLADFCFFAGKPQKELVQNKPKERTSDFIIMIPQNEGWGKLIEEAYGRKATKTTRYAIKKETGVFDVEKLKAIVAQVDAAYQLQMIDQKAYDMALKNEWSADFCAQFKPFEEFYRRGLGVVALHNGELVSGASSYTVYQEGIEIEIGTRDDYRRKGLALACGAKLILACLERNLYPSWDAKNKESVALSEKLGYHFDQEYVAYEINGYAAK